MKRMSTLAALAHPGVGELQANIDKYKEESEKEDINEVCPTGFSSVVLPLSNHLTPTDRVSGLYINTIKGTRRTGKG
jgi:hypothetical protein